MANIYDAHRETRDSTGIQDDTRDLILFGAFKENVGIEEGATQVLIQGIGNAFILGHPTNAILGTQELGAEGYGTPQLTRVVNPNNIFHEHFRFSDFNDTTKTTGSFSTTYYNVCMDNGEIFQTKYIFKNVESVNYATIYVDLTGVKSTQAVSGEGGITVTLTESQ